jgi:hypothetical protein
MRQPFSVKSISTTRPVTAIGEVPLQHRHLALPGGLPHQGKAGGKDGECERRFEPHAMPAHRDYRAEAGNCRSDARP